MTPQVAEDIGGENVSPSSNRNSDFARQSEVSRVDAESSFADDRVSTTDIDFRFSRSQFDDRPIHPSHRVNIQRNISSSPFYVAQKIKSAQVVGAQLSTSQKPSFVVYKLQVIFGEGQTWYLQKRYSDFVDFREKIKVLILIG